MKQLLKLSLLLLAVILPATATAQDFIVDGIYYYIINDNEAGVTFNDEASYTYSGAVNIPPTVTYNGTTYSVTAIGMGAFECGEGWSPLTEITIPNSITSIGQWAFGNCARLTSITIPSSVSYIGDGAFHGCGGLTRIIVESGNPKYDSRENCNAIIETASNKLIRGSNNTTIPNSIISIGDCAFDYCAGLTSINIPSSVVSIGYNAFEGCYGLTELVWNAKNCNYNGNMSTENIEHVTIGSEVEIIPNNFVANSKITSLTLPNSIIIIGENAFNSCKGLTSITIPNAVTSISKNSFAGCSGLTSLLIPNSVATIGDAAFLSCTGLANVSIPKSVSTIGKKAFYNCPAIETVSCDAVTPPSWSGDLAMFTTNVYNHTPLYVPSGKERAYMTDLCWGQFLHIFGMQDEVLATDITLSQSQMNLIVGSNSLLTATVLPDSTTNKSVIWASSDPTVASVDATGMVSAIAPGSATIIATTTDGSNLTALCNVTVNEDMTDFDNYLLMPDTTAFHNETIIIPVRLTNSQEIFAFQTDIYLPEGFTIMTDDDDEYVITPSDRLTSDHIIMANDYGSAIRVICYTPNALPINGNEGDLFYFTVMVPNNAEGDHIIRLQNTLLTTSDFNEIAAPNVESVVQVKTYIPGDVNDSRTVNVTDIVVAARYVLGLNPSPFNFEAADMNGDGNVTVTDIMLIAYLINHPTMNAPRRLSVLTSGNDCLSGEGVTLAAGEKRTVSIRLDNEMLYTAFQLDLTLPEGLTISNFQLTDRVGNHAFDVNTLANGKTRALCYSPAIETISGHSGALLTFDVTATDAIEGNIFVDGIEFVTADCLTVLMNGFAIGVNTMTGVNEIAGGQTVARVDFFNLAGQQIDRPESGVTLVVTTYTDGTRTAAKVIK